LFIDVDAANFNSLPLAAHLCDPSVAAVLLQGNEYKPLLDAAKKLLIDEVSMNYKAIESIILL
jgi:hypothetical protein